jgi:hypothetical protein
MSTVTRSISRRQLLAGTAAALATTAATVPAMGSIAPSAPAVKEAVDKAIVFGQFEDFTSDITGRKLAIATKLFPSKQQAAGDLSQRGEPWGRSMAKNAIRALPATFTGSKFRVQWCDWEGYCRGVEMLDSEEFSGSRSDRLGTLKEQTGFTAERIEADAKAVQEEAATEEWDRSPEHALDVPDIITWASEQNILPDEITDRKTALKAAAALNRKQLERDEPPHWALVVELSEPIEQAPDVHGISFCGDVGVQKTEHYAAIRVVRPTAEEIALYAR